MHRSEGRTAYDNGRTFMPRTGFPSRADPDRCHHTVARFFACFRRWAQRLFTSVTMCARPCFLNVAVPPADPRADIALCRALFFFRARFMLTVYTATLVAVDVGIVIG